MNQAYDALGRRADRTVASTTETAHYGDLTDIATLDTDAGGVIRSFFSGPAGLVEQRDGSTTAYPLPDEHGDITTLADVSGASASRQVYDPWGNQLSGPASPFGWLGAQLRRSDPGTGLNQMGVRPYVSVSGRFLAEDPVLGHPELSQSWNRYVYALGNAINYYDLTGLSACDDSDLFFIAMPACAIEYYSGSSETCDESGNALEAMAACALDEYHEEGPSAIGPSRIVEYFDKAPTTLDSCNPVQVALGGLVTGATAPLIGLYVESGEAVVGAQTLWQLLGASSAAAGELGMAGTVGLLGPHILSRAC